MYCGTVRVVTCSDFLADEAVLASGLFRVRNVDFDSTRGFEVSGETACGSALSFEMRARNREVEVEGEVKIESLAREGRSSGTGTDGSGLGLCIWKQWSWIR